MINTGILLIDISLHDKETMERKHKYFYKYKFLTKYDSNIHVNYNTSFCNWLRVLNCYLKLPSTSLHFHSFTTLTTHSIIVPTFHLHGNYVLLSFFLYNLSSFLCDTFPFPWLLQVVILCATYQSNGLKLGFTYKWYLYF